MLICTEDELAALRTDGYFKEPQNLCSRLIDSTSQLLKQTARKRPEEEGKEEGEEAILRMTN